MAQNYTEVLHFSEMLNLQPAADPKVKYSPKIRIICSYLYFMQGVIISLPSTMTLMYSEVPTYSVLSVFSAALLPFSFKFLQAPFIEKFTNVEYGKRKTWIITSQILASSLLFLASFLTADKHQLVLAVIFLLTILCITLQDISLDAMSIKQLKSPHIVGLTQAIMQTFGVIVGGLMFLKASSMQFAISIGRTQRIADVSTSLRVISMFLLIPTAIIHFVYQQSILKSERKVNTKSLFDIIKTYRIFLNPGTKYCRAIIIFLLCTQGFNPFSAGYEYELIHKGFLKNTINTIGNIVLIPITVFAIYISPKINQIGWLKCVIAVFIGKAIYSAFILFTFQFEFSTSESFVSFSLLCSHLFDTSYFILNSVLINSFPVMGLSGMFITMMASCWNFGQLKSPSLALIGVWGWKTCSVAGLILQIGLIAAYPWAYKWMMSAEYGVDAELMQKKSDNSGDQLSNSMEDEKKKRDKQMIEMVMMNPPKN